MASFVEAGEWTTYGDVGIAVRGDTFAARTVGRAAATPADFPNPHRVLQEDGRIPEGWHSSEGKGPEECERRLNLEGVTFVDGVADKTRRVMWDVARARSEAAATSEGSG
jgi:alkylated DNA nucleotide flippase Atl1